VCREIRRETAAFGRAYLTSSFRNADEIQSVVKANVGKKVRVVWNDRIIQWVDVASCDDEGFMHSGPDGENPSTYFTRFDTVERIDSANDDC